MFIYAYAKNDIKDGKLLKSYAVEICEIYINNWL